MKRTIFGIAVLLLSVSLRVAAPINYQNDLVHRHIRW